MEPDIKRRLLAACQDKKWPAFLVMAAAWCSVALGAENTRLPSDVWPAMGCWFWTEKEFAPEGYRPFLDLVAKRADFNFLTTSLRLPGREVTDPEVLSQIKQAAAYARQSGMAMVMDLDVRLARRAFQQAYPGELQEMLRLREVELPESGEAAITIAAETLGDHYTFRATPYVPVSARLVRVYSYFRGDRGIKPESLEDITSTRSQVKELSTNQVRLAIACDESTRGRRACVLAAFAHLTPDVFAPHLMSFQRQILRQYRDTALAGACKDEWGFPPCFDGCPAKNDFWFSRGYETAYAERTGGHDLVRDCLLMYLGETGWERERQAAINHYLELAWQRNAALEEDFYLAVKEVFGARGLVATHPTWWPYPDLREFKKNGLDWWVARRDLAQTDEVTPFAVRTALAKKWGSAVWYNMFYSSAVADYERSLWSHALGGGRINFHPLYPAATLDSEPITRPLLNGDLMRGAARVRLLNFITRSALDCPVAVIFGHACAMNWAGPDYNDTGLAVADALWRQGYPADLIPADEIRSGALRLTGNGAVQYGAQRYAAAVLYHPEFEPAGTAGFFQKAATGPTALYRLGNWTRDFNGQAFTPQLPSQMALFTSAGVCVSRIVGQLRQANIPPQTPAIESIGWDQQSAAPPRSGSGRLIDGTIFLVAGTQSVAGDVIETNLVVNYQSVTVKAEGVFALRLADDGALEAMAAGGLRQLHAGALSIQLEKPVDLALWRMPQGRWQGVLQDTDLPVPASLMNLTTNWLRLDVPKP